MAASVQDYWTEGFALVKSRYRNQVLGFGSEESGVASQESIPRCRGTLTTLRLTSAPEPRAFAR